MKKNWLAVLIVLMMVLGMAGSAAAEVDEREEGEGGPPDWVVEMQKARDQFLEDFDPDQDEDEMEGPPAFIHEMLKQKFHPMGKDKLIIHGKPLESPLPPVIKEGRTLIPVRAVMNGLGAYVDWNPETNEVTITKGDDEIVIVLTLGEETYTVNNVDFTLDVQAQLIGNRTYVPLKFIAVALGEDIFWNEETKEVFVGRGREIAEAAKEMAGEMKNDDDDDD